MSNGKKDEEDIEFYILNPFEVNNENTKEKLVQYWKNDKIKLLEQKNQQLEKLREEKNILEDKNDFNQSNEKEFHLSKRKYEHMKAYVDRCLDQVQNQMDIQKGNNQWHPNDVELVQAVVAANRYSFQNIDQEEYQFQRDIKKQKINKENNIDLSRQENHHRLDFPKTIHTRKWNANVTIHPIIVSCNSHNNDNIPKNRNDLTYRPIEKTFLNI